MMGVEYEGQSDGTYGANGTGTVTWPSLNGCSWTGKFLNDEFSTEIGIMTFPDKLL